MCSQNRVRKCCKFLHLKQNSYAACVINNNSNSGFIDKLTTSMLKPDSKNGKINCFSDQILQSKLFILLFKLKSKNDKI